MRNLGIRTPLHRAPGLTRHLDIDLWIKRDDLFPLIGGGNKARKFTYLLPRLKQQGCSALVTTGGIQSNHARVAALAAAAQGWRCKLVLHGDPACLAKPKGNLLLMLLAGAKVQVVDPDSIAHTMDVAMDDLQRQGYTPFYLPGGGHSVDGAMAYVKAMEELQEQCQKDGWIPEWIILPSGTGTTQAGLVVGIDRLRWPTKVVGISVARSNPRGRDIVTQACEETAQSLELEDKSYSVDFRDNWVGEGYERANAQVLSSIHLAAREEGLVLDPTYTGKAFSALLDLVRDKEIARGSRVLFWHTGGLMNLLASDYPILAEDSA